MRYVLALAAGWSLTFLAASLFAVSPVIDTQPSSQSILLYQDAALSVVASGTPPLAYQWQKNGLPIPGANGYQLILSQAKFKDAASYSVVVSNSEGKATSQEVSLDVTPPQAGDVDYSFLSPGGIDGEIWSIAVQSDGKILIGGSFHAVRGALRNGLARLNPDGSTDYTFGSAGGVGEARSILPLPDGKLMIMGNGGETLLRLNADASGDSNFPDIFADTLHPPGCAPWRNLECRAAQVNATLTQMEGKILLAGNFATINFLPSPPIVRVNGDGSLDTNFVANLGNSDVPLSVSAVAIQNDDKLIVAGRFSRPDGTIGSGIRRLLPNGTLDITYPSELAFMQDARIDSIFMLPDGKLLIAGIIPKFSALKRPVLLRLGSDGLPDLAFQDPLDDPTETIVISAPLPDGKILITGQFTLRDANHPQGLARLNSDGTVDKDFQEKLPSLMQVSNMVLQDDGKILIVTLETNDGLNRQTIARLNTDGSLDLIFRNPAPGPQGAVRAVLAQADGKLLVGGEFSSINDSAQHYLARLDSDGTIDREFKLGRNGIGGWVNPYQPGVYTLALQSDSKILVGGNFSQVQGQIRKSIARLQPDGSLDTTFTASVDEGPYLGVFCTAEQEDGRIIIGGTFNRVNGARRSNIARLNSDGSLDANFQCTVTGEGCQVRSVVLQPEGTILVGGFFTSVNGVHREGIVRLNPNGTLDPSFNFPMTNTPIAAVAFQKAPYLATDGASPQYGILIGGGFPGAFKRLLWNGSIDSSFARGISATEGVVHALAVGSKGQILVTGEFAVEVNGLKHHSMIRLNANGTFDNSFQAEDAAGYALAVQGEHYFVGGSKLLRLWGSTNIPPRIDHFTANLAGASFSWDAIPGRKYKVQFKESTSSAKWFDLRQDLPESEGTASDAAPVTSPTRFFRVLLLTE